MGIILILQLSRNLSLHNVNVPKVLLHNPELGITIQEDLGDDDPLRNT